MNDCISENSRKRIACGCLMAFPAPREILTPVILPETELLTTWLTERKGSAVHLLTPQRGSKRDLILLAADNAAEVLRQRCERDAAKLGKRTVALQELLERLALDRLPLSDHTQLLRAIGLELSQTMGGSSGVLLAIFFAAAGDGASSGLPMRDALSGR